MTESRRPWALAEFTGGKWQCESADSFPVLPVITCDGPHWFVNGIPVPTEPPEHPEEGDVVQYLALTFSPGEGETAGMRVDGVTLTNDCAITIHHPSGYDPERGKRAHSVYTVGESN